MIRTAVIDQDPLALEKTLGLLSGYDSDLEMVGTADSVDKGVQLIESQNPDLVLLDIRLAGGTGFDLLTQIGPGIHFELIFVTALDQYVINAIRFSALDYLLKPLQAGEVHAAIEKAIEKIRQSRKQENSNQELIRILVENDQKKDSQNKKLVLPDLQGFKVVDISTIIRLEGSRNYTHFFFADGSKSLVSKILKGYEQLLSPHDFMRVHQSHIVNLNFVRRYVKGASGQVEMVDGSILPVSRSKKDDFLAYFDD